MRKPGASKSGTSQPYATKLARGTARPVSLSLTAAEVARLDALVARHGLRSRSDLVRAWIAVAEAGDDGG